MKLTDIFIKRPVLSSVVSLMILVLGLASMTKLPLRQFPKMENTTITVTTAYPGASADVVQGFVTTPLEKSIGSADGIDYLEAQSSMGVSTITAHIILNYDPNTALTDITGKVNAVMSQLPQGIYSPVIDKETGQSMPDLILGFTSKTMSPEQISAYLENVVSPNLNSLGGISQIKVFGEKKYAMRIWLDPQRMALLNVSPTDVKAALLNNNVQATAGQLKSQYVFTDISLNTDLHTTDEFNNLVVKNESGRLIRIRDIGNVEMGSEDYDAQVYFNGQQAVFIGISSAPQANPLTVVENVIKAFPALQKGFPPGLNGTVVYNSTSYIQASIDEVIHGIIEATLIVVVVIFLFLGALRSVMIPVITIPLSLIGVCFLMLAMNFSLNLLTLLAMVLAIGLVVDDAIVVLENIYRHIEEGLTPFQAAIKGAREIQNPVIVMTTTLAAVFAPIGFMGGLTGALFTEFAFTLAAAVIISGIIALTFSPMLCSKVIDQTLLQAKLVQKIDVMFNRLKNAYQRLLTAVLGFRGLVLIFGATVLISCYFLYTGTQSELAPTEDQSFLAVFANGPSSANLNYLQKFNPQLEQILNSFPEKVNTFQIDGFPSSNGLFGGMILKPWSERKTSQMSLTPILQNALGNITGLEAFAVQWPSLPGVAQSLPIQFVITTIGDHKGLAQIMPDLEQKAMASGLFMFVTVDLKYDKQELNIDIDRAKAASLGIQMSDIAQALNVNLSGGLVNYFSQQGYSFEVIPQVPDDLRMIAKQLGNIYVSTASGQMTPLSSVITFSVSPQPSVLYQFQQLNAATLQGMLMPGVSIGQGLAFLQQTADQILPKEMSYNYLDQSRQFMKEGNALIYAFIFAMIVIFLVLAAQFESFRDPLIILVAVPMSICGALIPLYLGIATINIYTQIGLITLIGLISKHGILMVQFANEQQEAGLSIRDAIIHAAAIRLRPILMTTAAMVFGVVPLILASGAGAVSRFNLGLVIASGMLIGTCFTLFVVPTIYTYLAKDRLKDLKEKAAIHIMPNE